MQNDRNILKCDKMHTIRTINAFICISNHVNSCVNSMLSHETFTYVVMWRHVIAPSNGELSQHRNTRVPSEPRYELRKRNHSQNQQKSILLLIHKFEKLSIHERNEEDLSKTFKESVDSKGIIFPPFPIIPWSKDWLGHMKLSLISWKT